MSGENLSHIYNKSNNARTARETAHKLGEAQRSCLPFDEQIPHMSGFGYQALALRFRWIATLLG